MFVKVWHQQLKHAMKDQTTIAFSSPQLLKLTELHGTDGENCAKANDAISLYKQGGVKKRKTKRKTSTRHHEDLNHKLPVTLSDKKYLGKQLMYFM